MPHISSPAQNRAELKLIEDLFDKQFIVPQYQRGYRWTKQQVGDLLADLWNFHLLGSPSSFYCLQPVIVKKKDSQYELIDGQQRLTTIYILLRYLHEVLQVENPGSFSLEFATRLNSRDFLQKIKLEQRKDNIDFYHICGAQECIAEWFKGKEETDAAQRLYTTLRKHTSVIWYQLDETPGAEHEVFMRINSGKIPLTNAELIKALFLKRSAEEKEDDQRLFERRQLEIATEWDRMEARLQDDAFWYFLNKKTKHAATRLDFVFNSLLPAKEPKHDEYDTFRYFNNELNKATTDQLVEHWQRMKERFQLLESWFTNRNLYHLVGYLISTDVPVQDLIKSSKNKTKKAFKAYLKQHISERINWERLEELSYGSDNKELQRILLLFNVETMRKSKDVGSRFPFYSYNGAGTTSKPWSLEHIHAQNDIGLSSSDQFRQWLEEALPHVEEAAASVGAVPQEDREFSYVQPTSLLASLQAVLSKGKIEKPEFDPLRDQVLVLFGKPNLHTLENLALLASDHNSSLSNGAFPQKRARIIELEKEGAFIPIGTRNVFLKYYTLQAKHLNFWTETDRESYFDAIKKSLKPYFTPSQAPA